MHTKYALISGYTLIEILIVLLIISIVTSFALLSITRNDNRELNSFAKEVTQLLSLAEEEAILQPNVLGLRERKDSLEFVSFQENSNKTKASWVPLVNSSLSKIKIPDDIDIKIDLNHQKQEMDGVNPPIVISTNGDITPFTIYISKNGNPPFYVVKGETNGKITSYRLA